MTDPATVNLTDNEREALEGLRGTDHREMYRNFQGISDKCNLHDSLIRRTVRSLARKGLAIYARGLWCDDGTPGGAGYSLTTAGQSRLEQMDGAAQ